MNRLRSSSLLGLPVFLSCALGSTAALAQPRPAPPPDPQPAQPAPAPEAAAQDARLRALEDKMAGLEKRTESAEKKAVEAEQLLERTRVENAAAAAAVKRRAAEDAAAAKKKVDDEKAKAADFQPEKVAFAFGDFSWIPGNYGPAERPLTYGPFTGELRVDTVYHYSFANPADNTISGSSEVFRHNEFQVTQLGIGGDFYYKGAHARLMTQFGMYSMTTPRNDASPSRGQWRLDDAYRYLSEAYGGYHIDALHGINIQAGIFMSYVGLWSYYNFDNWTYQPSYVSSNTPWFFNGMRIQFFPSETLKIEPWLVNGWQSYGKFNQAPGVGLQVVWRPNSRFSVLGNQYFGSDTLGQPGRLRIHTDDSIMAKYYDNPGGAVSKAAASLTFDAGCEWGGEGALRTECDSQFFVGFMAYTRFWFAADRFALTAGGGAIRNPGRYLVLVPPVNGATAFSGTPYFTAAPKDPFDAWDMQLTGDYMPSPNVTVRLELNHREASVPYFAGPGGVTPPGGNQGAPGSVVEGWTPDLVKTETRLTGALLLRL